MAVHGAAMQIQYKCIKRDFSRSLRNTSREYDRRELERIDKLAELDQAGFWKVVNSRKTKSSQTYTQMNVYGNTPTHPNHILDGWRSYFENLYSFPRDREVDDDFKTHIEAEVPKLLKSDKISFSRSLSTPVTYCEL